jgi:FtsZ-binding cell division protein ZapB
MPKKPKKLTLTSLRKKAPRIPDYTCVSIDKIIDKLEKLVERKKSLDKKQLKDLTKRLEKLRTANEKLRDSGIYWYEKLKHLLKTR